MPQPHIAASQAIDGSAGQHYDPTIRYRIDGGHNEAPALRPHRPPLADPRAHPGLPTRGRVGAAHAWWSGRLPAPRGHRGRRRRLRKSVASGSRALGRAQEARGAPRLGCREDRARLAGPDPPRPPARRSPGCAAGPEQPEPSLPARLPARERVRRGDRQQDDARRDASRLGSGRSRRLSGPDGRPGQAERATRSGIHGRDPALSLPRGLPGPASPGRTVVEATRSLPGGKGRLAP
jgi:hypothetical protein